MTPEGISRPPVGVRRWETNSVSVEAHRDESARTSSVAAAPLE